MSQAIDIMWDTVRKVSEQSRHVFIDRVAAVTALEQSNIDATKPDPDKAEPLTRALVAEELLASAVNYCYWYGCGDVRPNGASSSKMYEILKEASDAAMPSYNHDWFEGIKQKFYRKLAANRFPMLEERKRHIDELTLANVIYLYETAKAEKIPCVDYLIQIPGFGSDIFIKRAQLFFQQIQRRCICYDWGMDEFGVPADYQVPRVLRDWGILNYDEKLSDMVDDHIMIPKGSRYEVEIRAATIDVCEFMAKKAGVTATEIDWLVWSARKTVDTPFHLTVTTDY